MQKDPRTYEHVPPESVGNQRHILVSDQAGRSNIMARLAQLGIDVAATDKRIGRLLEDVKSREYLGYAYDGAEASFELLARRALGQVPTYFEVESFRVMVERRHNAIGDLVTVSEAVVKLNVGGETFHNVGSGNGPVNALDQALRKDLGRYSSYLQDLRLVDYKVRILTGGTEAVTRVMIESADGHGARWSTVGVSRQHRGRLVRGAVRFDLLQALPRRRAGVTDCAGVHHARPVILEDRHRVFDRRRDLIERLHARAGKSVGDEMVDAAPSAARNSS